MSYSVEKHAKVIVHYCLELGSEDYVYITTTALCEPLISAIKKEATIVGAQIITNIIFEDDAAILYQYASDEFLERPDPVISFLTEKITAYVNIDAPYNLKSNTNVDPDKIKKRNQANADSFARILERMGEGNLKVLMTEYPTAASAQESSTSTLAYRESLGNAMGLELEDPTVLWKKIHMDQEKYCHYLNTIDELHIVSKDTDITMSVKGRQWVNCDGKINMPDGEVFTGPIENTVNGKIRFSYPGIFQGKEVEDICLEFENGKVVKGTAKKGQELLDSVLDTDEGARFVGEIAVGTNYGVKNFTKNILLDEKTGGTIHLAIGHSLPDTGGVNESTIHWDLLCDMREHGQIFADGQLIYEKGQWIESIFE